MHFLIKLMFFHYLCIEFIKQMRHFLQFIMTTLMVVGICGCGYDSPQETEPMATDTIPELITRIQKCSRLYTTEYHIHKIVTHDDIIRLKGNIMRKNFNIALPLGDRKIAIPMDATLKGYIDLADFSENNIERNGDHITILLPDPQVTLTSSKINQKEIRSYVGLTRSYFTDKEMTNFEQQGRQAILNNISNTDIIRTTQENAARVLVPIMVQLGYKEENVTIAFRKNLDVLQLIHSSLENNGKKN